MIGQPKERSLLVMLDQESNANAHIEVCSNLEMFLYCHFDSSRKKVGRRDFLWVRAENKERRL